LIGFSYARVLIFTPSILSSGEKSVKRHEMTSNRANPKSDFLDPRASSKNIGNYQVVRSVTLRILPAFMHAYAQPARCHAGMYCADGGGASHLISAWRVCVGDESK